METVSSIIRGSNSKSCSLDAIPTKLLKDSLDTMLPYISKLANLSLANGVFPDIFKRALIRPLLKKPQLDANDYSSYRPIANLSFLSKTLERIVASQLCTYLEQSNLLPNFQSAYRRNHSTETAILKVVNDIQRSLDDQKEVVLVLLDLSSAFDTLDHSILLDRLHSRYGISDIALKWLISYLRDRSQSVVVGDASSSERHLLYGVPQGSVLGPLLFALYFAPLEDIIHAHGLTCMFYADDTQLYIMLDPKSKGISLTSLQSCHNDIFHWLSLNKLVQP